MRRERIIATIIGITAITGIITDTITGIITMDTTITMGAITVGIILVRIAGDGD